MPANKDRFINEVEILDWIKNKIEVNEHQQSLAVDNSYRYDFLDGANTVLEEFAVEFGLVEYGEIN